MADLTTWLTVKARLGLNDSQEDETERLISVASSRAEHYTGRVLASAEKTLYRNGEGGTRLILGHWPINSVSEVKVDSTYEFGSESVVTDYKILSDIGVLHRGGGWPEGINNVKVTATVGYVSVPEDLAESIIRLVGYWLQSPQISWLGTGDAAGGGYQTQYVGVMDLPFQVRNVWDYYRAVIV